MQYRRVDTITNRGCNEPWNQVAIQIQLLHEHVLYCTHCPNYRRDKETTKCSCDGTVSEYLHIIFLKLKSFVTPGTEPTCNKGKWPLKTNCSTTPLVYKSLKKYAWHVA